MVQFLCYNSLVIYTAAPYDDTVKMVKRYRYKKNMFMCWHRHRNISDTRDLQPTTVDNILSAIYKTERCRGWLAVCQCGRCGRWQRLYADTHTHTYKKKKAYIEKITTQRAEGMTLSQESASLLLFSPGWTSTVKTRSMSCKQGATSYNWWTTTNQDLEMVTSGSCERPLGTWHGWVQRTCDNTEENTGISAHHSWRIAGNLFFFLQET